jgi:hypothetical protein
MISTRCAWLIASSEVNSEKVNIVEHYPENYVPMRYPFVQIPLRFPDNSPCRRRGGEQFAYQQPNVPEILKPVRSELA